MGLEEDFEGGRTRLPRQKVSLGGRKPPAADATPATGSPPAKTTAAAVPSALPLITVSSGSDQVAGRAQSKRGKDKAPVPEGAPPTKRSRPAGSSSRTPILDALVGGDGHPGDLMSKLNALLPDAENIKEWETTLVAEKGTRELLQLSRTFTDLFCRTKAGERLYLKEVEANKKAMVGREAQIQNLVKRAEAAESKVATAVSDYKNSSAFLEDATAVPAQLAEKVFGTPTSSEAFFRAMLKTRVGEGLVREYGKWAFKKGKQKIFLDVNEALADSLDDDDLATILGVLLEAPDEPGPAPYTGPDSPPPVTEGPASATEGEATEKDTPLGEE